MTTLYLKSCDICQAQGSTQTPSPSFALEARLDESETCRGGKRHVDLGSKFGTQLVFKYIKHVTFTDGIFVE